MKSINAARAAGITYRQLDFWTRAGYVRPGWALAGHLAEIELTEEQVRQLPEKWREPVRPGSGSSRVYDAHEVEVLCRMAALLRIGFTLARAAELGRQLVEHPTLPVWLGEGAELRVLPDVGHPQCEDYQEAFRAAHGAQDGAALAEQLERAHRLVEPC